ncbi:MAG: hypothetical protein BAA04_01490 [Firmicutes bacterium ZCTH02-B6]|nr:MAG: hypothetical protein BAA04_01490 [Firmicutes bacterium ZCTH02-B6]
MSGLRSFYIDPETRDLEFDRLGQLKMVESDAEQTAERQRLRLRLGTRAGEWFLDVLLGVPWLELVEKGVPRERIRAEILKALHSDEQVERVESLTIGQLTQDRTLPIEFQVRLKGGTTLADRVEVAL